MLLIDLHDALLLGSPFSLQTQLALQVAFKLELLKQPQYNAVLLLWLACCTSKQTPGLHQQLLALIQAGALQSLIALLPATGQHSSATSALLRCITRLAASATPQQLAALCSNPINQTDIVSASCSSKAAGAAAAELLISALSRGIHVSRMLEPLLMLQANDTGAPAAAAAAAASVWVANAMPPLLKQLQQQLSLQDKRAAAPAELQPLQQELWLLLSAVAAVAQAAGPSASLASLAALGHFYNQPAVTLAMQAALLDRAAPAAQAAVVQMTCTLAGLSVELAQCCFKAVASVVTQLLLPPESARHSNSNYQDTLNSSSCCCMTLGVPLELADDDNQGVQQLCVQQAAADTPALAKAVRSMWALLLQRVSSRQTLEAEVARQLPQAAAAVACIAPMMTALPRCMHSDGGSSSSSSSKSSSSLGDDSTTAAALAQVSTFVPLASSYSCCSKPLLPYQQQLTVTALLPHVKCLIQIVVAAPAALTAARRRQDQQQQQALPEVEALVLLALWMLHSYTSSLQQQQQQQQQQCQNRTDQKEAAAFVNRNWGPVLVALAALTADGSGSPQAAAHLHMQTAALQLARCLLLYTPAGSTSLAVAPNACSTGWQHMIAATDAIVGTSAALPLSSSMAKRQLLCCACKLAADIARRAPLLLQQIGITPAGSSSSSSSSSSQLDVCKATPAAGALNSACQRQAAVGSYDCSSSGTAAWCQLSGQLRLLLLSLRRRKLERSGSGQELLGAAENALAAVEGVLSGRPAQYGAAVCPPVDTGTCDGPH